MSELEPIDPELRALLDVARPNDAAPDGARARLDARLAATLAGGAAIGGAAGALHAAKLGATAGLARTLVPVIASFIVGGVMGAAILRATESPPPARVVYVDRPVPTVATSTAPVDAGAAPEPEPVPAAPSARSSVAPSRTDSVAAERAMLDVARHALEQGDGATALATAERHARTFPAGALAQEREAIAIRALVMLGRPDDARARAARFVTRFPDSLLRPAVEAAVANP